MRSYYDDMLSFNVDHIARSQTVLMNQMSSLLRINVHQLDVAQESLDVQYQQLNVQAQIRNIGMHQLALGQEQLKQAMRTVQRLDVTNQRLAKIDASLADISGVLAQQNALIQKSLNRLANEAQELLERGMEAYANGWFKDAARDFEQALERHPYLAMAHYFQAKCLAQDGRPVDARQAYQKCIYYGRQNAPIFQSLALCDLASLALKEDKPAGVRQLLERAAGCPEQDKPILVSALLQCDLAEGNLRPETGRRILEAFADEAVDPEVLLEVLTRQRPDAKSKLLAAFDAEKIDWEAAAQKALFERLISHFYRELDDFVYLAPRIRQGFMSAAGGKFFSLGAPLADLLDWTMGIGTSILRRIELFPPEYPEVLRFYRPLQAWNALLVELNKLTGQLAAKTDLSNDRFVENLNLGLVELPKLYEDDRIIFETPTEEGDTLALSCYYAIFTRNGQQHFPVPLHEFPLLKIETYPTTAVTKGVLVTDPRHGQTLIQGKTGSFEEDSVTRHFFIDHFIDSAALLSQIHECIQWAVAHEEELFSVFLLLNAVAQSLAAKQQPLPAPKRGALPPPVPPKPAAPDDDFDVVEDAPAGEEFEVVE